jgi:hypothetical protein
VGEDRQVGTPQLFVNFVREVIRRIDDLGGIQPMTLSAP